MKYDYEEQAIAVNTVTRNKGSDLDIALREAEVTLNALALIGEKKILILDDLIKVAEEFCIDAPSMDLCELIEYQNDFKKLLEKIK